MEAEHEPNDGPLFATPLPGQGEARGTIDAVADVDWFAVELTAGVPVRVGTRAFCEGGLQTRLAIYASDGAQLLASASGGGAAGHGLVEGFAPPADGTYLVKVTTVAATTGDYVLAVEAMSCETDSDCGCPDQVCSQGAAVGTCVPANALPEPASDDGPLLGLVMGERTYSAIDEAYDVDSFAIVLGAGHYDIETLPYCGAALDTSVKVFTADGELLAEDDDGGEGFFGAAHGVHLDQLTQLRVEVRAHGPSVGGYLVHVGEAAPAE